MRSNRRAGEEGPGDPGVMLGRVGLVDPRRERERLGGGERWGANLLQWAMQT